MPQGWSSPETASEVLQYLANTADEHGVSRCSFVTAGQALGYGRNTIHRAVTRLIAHRQIEVVRIGTGRDYPSQYRVLSGTAGEQGQPASGREMAA